VTTVEDRVLAAIDMPALLETLCAMIAIRSLDGEEDAMQHAMAAAMARSGLAVDQWSIDMAALQRHPDFCQEVERHAGIGVVGMLGEARGGPSLMLNGHVDVVPAGDPGLWRYPPWQGTIADGRVYGRGAVDMKGGLCCALFAARAIAQAGVRLRGRLLIASVIGEEDGGCGTLATLLRGHHADAAIVIEPTEGIIAPAQAGALNFRITVPGMAAHGCVRDEGISAIEAFIPIHQALLTLERERNAAWHDPRFADYALPYPLSIGTLHAGNWPSSVPEQLVAEGRYGVAIGEDLAAARAQFEATIAQAAAADPWLRQHPPIVTWWGGQFAPAAIASDAPIVGSITTALHRLNHRPVRVAGMTYGSDMRHLVNAGSIPTVLFGPGDVRRAHRPDEYVTVAELELVTRTLALAALYHCGYDA